MAAKKQPLLSTMSTNNSDAFLQKLAQDIRDRQESSSKSDDIVLLEKQGQSSQKTRRTMAGNLMQVAQTVGQNMTDISNIGEKTIGTMDKRGASLPPRNLKPPSPRKTFTGRLDTKTPNYQRLEDSSNPAKKRSLLPMPKMTASGRSNSSTIGNSNSRASPMHFVEPNYVSIQRSPSPARHAHFILGHQQPKQQQQQAMKSASLDRDRQESPRKSSLSGRSVNRYRIQF